jgi:hypothetical protein
MGQSHLQFIKQHTAVRLEGYHILPIVRQQHHRLQTGLLLCGAAGGQLTQECIGVIVVTLGQDVVAVPMESELFPIEGGDMGATFQGTGPSAQ